MKKKRKATDLETLLRELAGQWKKRAASAKDYADETGCDRASARATLYEGVAIELLDRIKADRLKAAKGKR